ncbi:MAG TPA: DUF4398 domain-containing protein [Mariprofundaceae bacterium]|nr:DUF4398 domain-containing protein [Mariprofundaceae bacterium]
MKYITVATMALTLGACSAHLPSTQISALDEVRTAIQQARDAGAEQCAPEELASAEASSMQAAHELSENSAYDDEQAAMLIDDALAASQTALEKCNKKAKPKPVIKPKPVPKVKPVVQTAPKPEVIELSGVFFENNSAKLTGASTETLNQVVVILKKRKDIKVEVAAHTDSGGKASYNAYLSGLRAEAVRNYLVEKGIAANRLTAKGYGEAHPIADNATREGRAKNRRVELIVQ